MKKVRLIARLDVKGPNLIKGVHLEGLRVIGSPNEYAARYYKQGADELIYMDSVASLYARNHIREIIKAAAKDIFIPITVGGGIRSIDDANEILRSGADKVAINTAAVADPTLISKLALKFGSQCVVLSIEAKKIKNGEWEVLTENGRERTGLNVVNWAIQGFEFGAGEILLTSVDMEGTRKGFDCDLVRSVSSQVEIPVIASGGMGKLSDAVEVVNNGEASAIAMADILHYNRATFSQVRKVLKQSGILVRNYEFS